MKRKKLYYLPGLVSIIGLPVLLFFWGPNPVFHNSIRLNLPSDKKEDPNILRFTNAGVYAAIKNKKITSITLGGHYDYFDDDKYTYVESRKLHFITQEIERLAFTEDSGKVVKIMFDDGCTYGDFIWVLNHALMYDFRRYALIDNELYFLPRPIFAKTQETYYPLAAETSLFPPAPAPTWWQDFKAGMTYKWRTMQYQFAYLFDQQKQNRILVVGFFLLVLVPGIFKIRKYIKNTRFAYPQT